MLKNTTIKLISKKEGVGSSKIKKAAQFCGLNSKKSFNGLRPKQESDFYKTIEEKKGLKNLKESKKEFLSFLIKLNSYKGIRHKLKYPARGQRTHTNAKTKKKFKI